MKAEMLLDVIGEAQEGYVEDAMENSGRKKNRLSGRRLLVTLAAAALAALLVGCGIVYVWNMQSLKLADRQWTDPVWNWRMGTQEPVAQRVIAYGGPQGTVRYQAAKEWYDFEIPYVQDHEWDENFICPPEYEAYEPYTQEMVDKLDEITEKYGLKPVGPQVQGESSKGLLNYLGIETALLPGAPAKETDLSASYYENGRMSLHFQLQMEDGDGRWPYRTYIAWSLSPKDCFESGVVVLDEPETWQEWHYTTAAGQEFLILYTDNFWECYAIADRGDASIFLWMQTAKDIYMEGGFSEELMTKEQVEQVLDTIDFTLTPQPGDPALLSGLPAEHDASRRVQTQNGYTVELKSAVTDGNLAQVTLGITVPEESAIAYLDTDGSKRFSLRFDRETVTWDGGGDGLLRSAQPVDDGDGLDNTADYVLRWYDQREDAPGFAETSRLCLTLEGLYREQYNQEKEQHEDLWRTDGVWRFEFAFDQNCDYRALEFIAAPTEIPAFLGKNDAGGENWGTMTASSVTLRTHSLAVQLQEELGYGDLYSWVTDTYPAAVLKDGSQILMHPDSGYSFNQENTCCQENLRPERPIPLEEVEYLLLPDGTKLCPIA